MGISIIHTALAVGVVLAVMRTWAYMLLSQNEDSRLGKTLAYIYA